MSLIARIVFRDRFADLLRQGLDLQDTRYNLLFTLGSIYSTSASGAEQTTETNNSN